MSVQTRIDCDKCKPLVLDDQGIDSGASGVMRRLKGSLDLGGESDRAFRAGINAPARAATLTPTAPARVGAGA